MKVKTTVKMKNALALVLALTLPPVALPAMAQENWPGSFAVQGSDTRVKVSGYAELDVIHDTHAILTPSAFVTKAIVTRNATPAQGSDGQTSFSIQPTRLAIETRTPLGAQRLTTKLEMDFFNNFGGTAAELRLRLAYGEVSNALAGGDLLFGQDWSTFTNLYAIPNVLDFQVPNAVFGTRHPMVRWTRPLGTGTTLKLAAEAPDLRYIERQTVVQAPVSSTPDGVAAIGWAGEAYNVQASFLARGLRASADDGSVVSDFGWGASLAGRVNMPEALKQDFASFSLTIGEGIGGVLNDVPPDAGYNPATNELKAIPTRAWYLGYQHYWNPQFYSVAVHGEVSQKNLDFQLPVAYKKTTYSSVNLTWVPHAQWTYGVEMLYGTREDKDGARGTDVRTLFVSRLSF